MDNRSNLSCKNLYKKSKLIKKLKMHLFSITSGRFYNTKCQSITLKLDTVVDRKDWTLHRAIEVKLP